MSLPFFLFSCILFISPQILIQAQQPYVGLLTANCSNTNASTSVLGYSCNGVNQTCQAYLTFRSNPPYNTVVSISNLLNVNPTQLSQLNSVSESSTFRTGDTVLVPARCSCLGQFYQANATYVVQSGDTPLSIAINTFEGLSTCQAIQNQRSDPAAFLFIGERLTVPLRCACPTKKQATSGVSYLLSYLISSGQTVSVISAESKTQTGLTLEANELSANDFIYASTTLLVPLSDPPKMSPTIAPPPTSNNDHKSVYMLVGILGGVALTFAIGLCVFWFFFLKRKKVSPPTVSSSSQSFEAIEKVDDKKLDVDEDLEFMEILSNIAQSLKIYKFEELKLATEDFSPNCLVKGSVYQGTINRDLVAIKKMNGDVGNEIRLLNTIHHHNIVRLLGACFDDGHWYLVYEFAVNGPLSDWIHYNVSSNKLLNWMQRMQIALDIANGLDYLHSYTTPPYIFKNLESNNILLDSDFRAKITNFNLARSAEGQFALTRHIVGTTGYMAPEYLENGLISTKLDVYGFGILLLEIVMGKNVSDLYEKVNKNLSEVLDEVIEEENIDKNEKLTDFIDQSIQGDYPPQLAMYVVKLIKGCLDKDPSARPDMNKVSHCLSTILSTPPAKELSLTISI